MEENMIPADQVPMTVTVEVTRLRVSLDKLLQLSPGNVLELPVKPEQGVDLTINGKKVAKAELIKMGDALGVKILQIGYTQN
jgi:flagellar motor switch protein FliN/FliY